jgi:hypothetical protein
VSVSPFYALARTPGAALAKFDPLPDEPLLKLLDPRTSRRRTSPAGRIRWLRLFLLWLVMTLPTVLLAWVQPPQPDPVAHAQDPPTFNRLIGKVDGVRLVDQLAEAAARPPQPPRTGEPAAKAIEPEPPRRGGLRADIDLFSMWTIWACYLALIASGRRLMGSLLMTLERTNIVAARPPGRWVLAPRNLVLRVVDAITRVDSRRAIVWGVALVALNVFFNLRSTMQDGILTWRTDPATPGSLFYFSHLGGEQANLAGIWHLAVASAMAAYLILLICRLYVVFAAMSEAVARDRTLRVMPTHPDGTGGLMPIGRASLFISLSVFVSGLGLTAIAVQSYVSDVPLTGIFFGMCAGYLVIGPVLFVLPLTPLRRVMIDRKQRYLLDADHMYHAVDARHRQDVKAVQLDANALQGQLALSSLIERAEGMTVWPFDRRTFRRFLALLVAPIVPVFKELPIVEELTRRILGE